jgi:pyruvate kinase
MNRHREPVGKVRTKIVATVGPASRDPAILKQLVEAGVDVFRLNFSHGTHAEHTETLAAIRATGEALGQQIAVIQDLCGPKIRLGKLPDDAIDCVLDAEFLLTSGTQPNGPDELTCSYRALAHDLEVGQTVLFADGTVAMDIVDQSEKGARLKVTLPGRIRSQQGINVPGAALSVSALTEKDLADLEWTAKHSVAYVGLSFVRSAADIVRLRDEFQRRGIRSRIIAKIEKPQAVANLDSIIDETDAVMVARGDLGVEIDVEKVPAVQKQIIWACHQARIPVITATQMLNSMESSSRPTRAESTDVFNAVLDGTDAVMLSGETAIGAYPVEAVATMSRIASEAEKLLFAESRQFGTPPWSIAETVASSGGDEDSNHIARAGKLTVVTESVVHSASLLSRHLNAALIVVATFSGRTAMVLSKQRNATPTLALATDIETVRAMALYWGVTPLHITNLTEAQQALVYADSWCRDRGLISPGDHVVLIRGLIPDNPTHNAIFVHKVE